MGTVAFHNASSGACSRDAAKQEKLGQSGSSGARDGVERPARRLGGARNPRRTRCPHCAVSVYAKSGQRQEKFLAAIAPGFDKIARHRPHLASTGPRPSARTSRSSVRCSPPLAHCQEHAQALRQARVGLWQALSALPGEVDSAASRARCRHGAGDSARPLLLLCGPGSSVGDAVGRSISARVSSRTPGERADESGIAGVKMAADGRWRSLRG
jgi:hypothetical protein